MGDIANPETIIIAAQIPTREKKLKELKAVVTEDPKDLLSKPATDEKTEASSDSTYGKVHFVDKRTPGNMPDNHKGAREMLKGFLKGKRYSEVDILTSIRSDVINRGIISKEDLDLLPSGNSFKDQIQLANVLWSISEGYNKVKFEKERLLQHKIPNASGMILSDFLESIPRPLAARILLAASNPNVSNTIMQNEGTLKASQSTDSQQCAVEATVMFPRMARNEIFDEMAKLSPGLDGGAYRHFAFIATNWPQTHSNYNGPKLIERSLSENQAKVKIREVTDDLTPLGAKLRGKAA